MHTCPFKNLKEAAREGSLHLAASLLLLADVKAAVSTLKLSVDPPPPGWKSKITFLV